MIEVGDWVYHVMERNKFYQVLVIHEEWGTAELEGFNVGMVGLIGLRKASPLQILAAQAKDEGLSS